MDQHGGAVTAIGGLNGAGIGGGYEGAGGVITINGGALSVNGDGLGAGIGGGGGGGEGGDITITGGAVTATGYSGSAGIGGGEGGAGGVITITGGAVTAIGGKLIYTGPDERASGIGGGYCGSGGDITITGGRVTATGESGIGAQKSYRGSDPGTITLSWTDSGDSIYAESYKGSVSFVQTGEIVNSQYFYFGEEDRTLAAADNIGGKTILPWTDFNDLSYADISVEPYYIATGSEIEPEPVVTDPAGKVLTRGTDYSVAYPDGPHSDPGDYTLTVTGMGGCTGSRTVGYTVMAYVSGAGTREDPYRIASGDDWDLFTAIVNAGMDHQGQYVRLENDITTPVTTMAGSVDHPFRGTFLGDGRTLTVDLTGTENNAAPFACVEGAAIEKLTVTGGIRTDHKYAGSLVGTVKGEAETTLTECVGDAAISSTVTGDGTHGGLAGLVDSGGTLAVIDCVFTGSLLGESTNACGGMAGWNSGSVSFTRCLFAPGEITVGSSGCATYNRGSAGSMTECYCTRTMGDPQGQMASETLPEAFCDKVSVCGRTLYAARDLSVDIPALFEGDSPVTVTYTVIYDGRELAPENYTAVLNGPGVVDGNTVSQAGEYTLTVTGVNEKGYYNSETVSFTVMRELKGSGTADDPCQISSSIDWTTFAYLVGSGDSFQGKYVKLTADVGPVTQMVGISGTCFSGVFNGDGHTLTVDLRDGGENVTGPFRFADGASFLGLRVAGVITTDHKDAGGFVGKATGTVSFSGCRSSVTIRSAVSGDGTHGGFVGVQDGGSSALDFTNCLFDGKLLGGETTSCGGFTGWRSGTAGFDSCLYAPAELAEGETEVGVGDKDTYTFSRRDVTAVSNSYYTRALGAGAEKGSPVGDMTAAQLVKALGSGWEIIDSGAVPKTEFPPRSSDKPSGGGGGGSAAVTNPVSVHASDAAAGGSVKSSAANARAGDKVTLTVIPDEGYILDHLTVTDGRGNTLPVTRNADGTYSFTMPNTAVTITPEFGKERETDSPDTPDSPVSDRFTDVPGDVWYHDAVRWAADNDVMKGVSADIFAPDDNATRAMVVTMLWRLAGEPASSAAAPFTDVEAGSWYADAVNWASENSVVNGTSETTFSPDTPVTREQLAAILYRYAQAQGKGFTGAWAFPLDFSDAASMSEWADEAMHWMTMNGIITGMGDGTLAPQGNATRAQIAIMFMRFVEAMEK